MLKIILLTVIISPLGWKNKWSLVVTSIIASVLVALTIPINKDIYTKLAYDTGLDVTSLSLIILRAYLAALIIIARTSVSRLNFKPTWFVTLILALTSLLL